MNEIMEGSHAIAHAIKMIRPQVIAAYPITPQTHIVEALADIVADGLLDADYVTVESEFSALSVCLGACAAGSRVYSATTSQGLALMYEVCFNVAGLRLPIVMSIVNRAMGAPLNIWNDQQDSISLRDSGWLQFYAEPFNSAAGLLGLNINDEYLNVAWNYLIQNSAHDSIGGCSLDEIHEDMMSRYKQSIEISKGVYY